MDAVGNIALRLVLGGGAGAAIIGFGLPLAGFTAGGIAAGSVAAGLQAGVGNVVAGSIFATCQSIAAGGAAALPAYLGATTVGAFVGAAIGDTKKKDDSNEDKKRAEEDDDLD